MGTAHGVCFWETKPEEYRDLDGDQPNQLRGHCFLVADNEYRLGFHRQLENDYQWFCRRCFGIVIDARVITLLSCEVSFYRQGDFVIDCRDRLLAGESNSL